jgi:predicted O-methyltransferase YrrM
MRRALILLAAVSGIAAVGLAVLAIEAATAALAISWLCGLAWMVLWTRATSNKLSRVLQHERATRRGLRQVLTQLSEHGRLEQQTASQLGTVRKGLFRVLVWVQRTPSVTHELGRVYGRLVDHDRPMPELGDWAISPSTLVWMLDRLSDSSVRTILELGSGSSTIWFATALAERGGEGRVVALESSAEYAESTRTELTKHGLRERAQVLHAPLVDTAVPGRENQPWFDISVLPDLPPVDLLFVDGPVGAIAREVRYPAYPLLADRLASGATIVLDDTGRPDEAAIVKAWKQESFFGRRLREVRRLDRATAFVSEDLLQTIDGINGDHRGEYRIGGIAGRIAG